MRARQVERQPQRPQRWSILAPALEERHHVTDGHGLGYGRTGVPTIIDGDFKWDAFGKLAMNRANKVPGSLEKALAKLPPKTDAERVSPLEKLPNEILSMILDDDQFGRADVAMIGLCSRSLWQQCLSHIKASACQGQWANTPLVCTGTYLETLPPAIYEAFPSLKHAADHWQSFPLPGPGATRNGKCPARDWNGDAFVSFKEVVQTRDQDWLVALNMALYMPGTNIHPTDREPLRQSLTHALRISKPQARSSWLLRNRTTREYVDLRCVITVDEEHVLYVKDVPALTLDKALMLRICRTKPGLHRPYRLGVDDLLQGKWAGHKFDVIAADVGHGVAGWRDVMTQDVVEEWGVWKGESERREDATITARTAATAPTRRSARLARR